MFERYTEKARRVIFFARREASEFGADGIDTEHLLLGLLQDSAAHLHELLAETPLEEIREQVVAGISTRPKNAAVDLPLTHDAKRALGYAMEESERLNHKHIGVEHLLLGLLRQEDSAAATVLRNCGVKIEDVRKQVMTSPTSTNSTEQGPAVRRPGPALEERNAADRLRTAIARRLESYGGIAVLIKQPVKTSPTLVRIPDVCVVLGDLQAPIQEVAPFVCIEILASNDRFGAIRERCNDYLASGVRHVWLLSTWSENVYAVTAETGLREVKDAALRTENPTLEIPLPEIRIAAKFQKE